MEARAQVKKFLDRLSVVIVFGAAASAFGYMLAVDKAECAGSTLKLVDPRGTSQTCPECGTIRRKTLAERRHTCDCGYSVDRDVAAARIVLHRAKFGPGTGLQAPSQRIAA